MLRRALSCGLSSEDFWGMSPAAVMAVSGGTLPPSARGSRSPSPYRGGRGTRAGRQATERETIRLGSLTDCPF